MFARQHFFHNHTFKVVNVFGSIFNDIKLKRVDSSGNEIKSIIVPIRYGPKEKWYYDRKQSTFNDDLVMDATLPALAFSLDSISYEKELKLSSISKVYSELKSVFTPVPYRLEFTLHTITKYTDDSLQILEQILPYFRPHLATSYIPLSEIPEYSEDLYFTLMSVEMRDNWDDDFIAKRLIENELKFSVVVNYYGYIEDATQIRKIIIDYGADIKDNLDSVARVMRITTEPDPINATPPDPFGYLETVEFFNDGKRRDEITGTDVDVD